MRCIHLPAVLLSLLYVNLETLSILKTAPALGNARAEIEYCTGRSR
nr:MAG TPA: hypothetical protein [Caudoviricetes sp.]